MKYSHLQSSNAPVQPPIAGAFDGRQKQANNESLGDTKSITPLLYPNITLQAWSHENDVCENNFLKIGIQLLKLMNWPIHLC